MKYSLVLDKPSAEVPTYIFVMATLSDGRLKYSIKEQILPSHWSREFLQPISVKDKKLNEEYTGIGRKLHKIKTGLEDLFREAKRHGRPVYKNEVINLLDTITGKAPKVDKEDFFAAADLILKDMESGLMLTPKGGKFSSATLVNYNQSIRALREYRPAVRFSEIDMNFYKGFIKHMNGDDLSLSSCGTHIKCFKRLLAVSFERGWHKNIIFMDKAFKTLSEQTDDIYLSEEEIKTLFEKRLLNKVQEICRDWFVLDCYTGLRISDIQQLSNRNFSGETILISNGKTDATVEIPVHPFVRQIIKKYKGMPPKVSDQEINREIKKVGELCKINEPFLHTITKGGKRVDTYYKKFEMISNHTARRSFITNLRKNGMPDAIVMKLAGLVKPATLARYDKLSPKEAAAVASQHPFFKSK